MVTHYSSPFGEPPVLVLPIHPQPPTDFDPLYTTWSGFLLYAAKTITAPAGGHCLTTKVTVGFNKLLFPVVCFSDEEGLKIPQRRRPG